MCSFDSFDFSCWFWNLSKNGKIVVPKIRCEVKEDHINQPTTRELDHGPKSPNWLIYWGGGFDDYLESWMGDWLMGKWESQCDFDLCRDPSFKHIWAWPLCPLDVWWGWMIWSHWPTPLYVCWFVHIFSILHEIIIVFKTLVFDHWPSFFSLLVWIIVY